MSEMTPLDAGFDLSIHGIGQASGGARTRRGVTAACRTQRGGGSDGGHFSTLFADFVTVASVISTTSVSFGVKILDPKINLTATCVRVPVFIGHSEAINIEFEELLSAEEARETPYECAGEDAIYVSRMREDGALKKRFVLWCLSANLREGAVLNAVQIVECLIDRKLIQAKRRCLCRSQRRAVDPPPVHCEPLKNEQKKSTAAPLNTRHSPA
jgi:Semialdehyde dehydrogenase, dimerisation domain